MKKRLSLSFTAYCLALGFMGFSSLAQGESEVLRGKIIGNHPIDLKINMHKLLENMFSGGLDFAFNQHLTAGFNGGIQPQVTEESKREFAVTSKATTYGASTTYYVSGLAHDSFYLTSGVQRTKAQANSFRVTKTKADGKTTEDREPLQEKSSDTTNIYALIGHKWQADYGIHFSAAVGYTQQLNAKTEGEIINPKNNSKHRVLENKLGQNFSAEVAVGIFL